MMKFGRSNLKFFSWSMVHVMMAGTSFDLPSLRLVPIHLFDVESNRFIKILVTESQKERAERDSLYAKTIIENYRELQCNSNLENESPNVWEGHSLPEPEIEEVAVPSVEDNAVQYTASTNEAWSEEETLLLISLYGDHHEDFPKAKKRKQVWTVISERMSALGYCRSAEKVERKWLNLMLVYRKIKDNKGPRKSGRGLITYKFYDKMDEIIGDKPSNNPRSSAVLEVGSAGLPVSPATEENDLQCNFDTESSSNQQNNIRCNSNDETTSLSENSVSEEPKQKRQRKTLALISKEYLEMKKVYLQQKEERQERKLQFEERRLELEERKIAVLEKYLNI